MRSWWQGLLTVVFMSAAFASAVPATESFFPLRKIKWLADDELAGSGFETSEAKVQLRGASRESPDLQASVRRWREIAGSARRDAQRVDGEKRARLIELAEWCEARASRLEAPAPRPDTARKA